MRFVTCLRSDFIGLLGASVLIMTACGGTSGGTTVMDLGSAAQDSNFVSTDGPGLSMNGDEAVITMTPFDVASGDEVFKCQTFANPFGADIDVKEFESHMTSGSHHLLLLFEDNAVDGSLQDCSGLTFGPMPYGTQRPDGDVTFPDGIATVIKATQGFKVVAHYINATMDPTPIHAQVQVKMHKADPSTITQHAGVFFLNNVSGLLPPAGGIPAGETKTITASYTTKIPINVLYATAHMHSRSTNMTATYNDTNMLYTTDSWSAAPMQAYTPPIALPVGTKITWSCTIANNTQDTITFGESAMTNEMCIFNGQYYPVPDNAAPTISVQK